MLGQNPKQNYVGLHYGEDFRHFQKTQRRAALPRRHTFTNLRIKHDER